LGADRVGQPGARCVQPAHLPLALGGRRVVGHDRAERGDEHRSARGGGVPELVRRALRLRKGSRQLLERKVLYERDCVEGVRGHRGGASCSPYFTTRRPWCSAAARSSSSLTSRALRVIEAARSNSPRASSKRPSFSRKSPRTEGSRWYPRSE